MAKNIRKSKNRMEKGSFVILRKDILNHPNYCSLTHKAARLLWDIWGQYNGSNNGDFCASYSVMRKKGWTSKDQLYKARDELVKKGFIEITRHGGLNMGCHLYAVTWEPIHKYKQILAVGPTQTPSNAWRRSPEN